ncbi:response regulator [Parvularcula oceani]|uniref:response regulator n=1 Tax=Parvularcula oceani TaxID=1247963 RepID=UPI0004E0E9BE|nr:response regulator [Parvularcula oceani]
MSTPPSRSALEGRRILIVEDEPMIGLELSFAFEDVGAVVQTARTVARALQAIEKHAPEAAVLDVNLGRDETCEPVAQRLQELGVPFVLHSGDLMRQGELIDDLGAQVVAKPSSPTQVLAAVARVVHADPG